MSANKIINRISRPTKKLAGFSLDVRLVADFKKACKKNNVKYSGVVDSLMRGFLNDLKKRRGYF